MLIQFGGQFSVINVQQSAVNIIKTDLVVCVGGHGMKFKQGIAREVLWRRSNVSIASCRGIHCGREARGNDLK